VLFQTSDTTWQAYNSYGGNSLYWGAPGINPNRAYKVSYNRPIVTRNNGNGAGPMSYFWDAEYPMVRWLEANGYNVSYASGVDTDRRGATALQQHRIYLSNGHDEYWSANERANVEAARNAGVNLAFFSGNNVFWKTRWENSIDGSNTPYRTLVSYKETHANHVIDPADPPIWTGTWRDARFSPPADGGRPENALLGNIFMVNALRTDTVSVGSAFRRLRFWRNTAVASLAPGGSVAIEPGSLGYEWNADIDNGFRPAGLIDLSSTTVSVNSLLLDNGSNFGPGDATHNLTLYRNPNGALVFSAGYTRYAWGLDSTRDDGAAAADRNLQQATVNLLADMGAQPSALQSGLVDASASTDTSAPVSTITSPLAGAIVGTGSVVAVTGTASDTGGTVGGVEVSVDGGATWHPAGGLTNWTYTWVTGAAGHPTLRSRAVDDSGNLETPSAGVAVTVGTAPTPTATATPSRTPTPAPAATSTPTPTVAPTSTSTPTATVAPVSTSTPTPTVAPASTSTPTATVAPAASSTPTPTVAPVSTSTPTPTVAPASTSTSTATVAPAASSTPTPTVAPVSTSTPTPTVAPASTSTSTATVAPVSTSTPTPTAAPASTSTPTPTVAPVSTSTPTPTAAPASTSTPTPTVAPVSTSTPTPTAVASATAVTTDTPTPVADASSTPTPTVEPASTSTSTPTAAATSTSTPTAAATSTSTPTAAATSTSTPTAAPTSTPTPTAAATSTSTPTPTVAATSTPTPTAVASATPVATATAGPGTQTVSFDDLVNPNRPMNAAYPTGLVDWGLNVWWLSGPWGQFTTDSVSFNTASARSASFTFLSPRRLVRLTAFNGGTASTTLTLACSGQATRTVVLAVNQVATIDTNWTATCNTVTVGSTNGWDTNLDTLVIDTGP
jgi:hypothetical protein